MDKTTNNNISQKVMAQIKTGNIKTKSKLYFLLRTMIYLFLTVLTFILAVFLDTFVAFALNLTELSFLLLLLAFAALLFILANILLIKKYSFFYRKPLAVSLLFLLFIISAVSVAVLKTPLHKEILERSQKKDVLFISPLYRFGCGCHLNNQTVCPQSDSRNKNDE